MRLNILNIAKQLELEIDMNLNCAYDNLVRKAEDYKKAYILIAVNMNLNSNYELIKMDTFRFN